MNETRLLYTLTTLAQTCAALAAFVGAVGLFRLQILREQRKEADQIRRLYIYAEQELGGGTWTTPFGKGPWVGPAAGAEARIRHLERANSEHIAVSAHRQWQAFERPIRNSRIALISFEVWNVGLIAVSLGGFNHIDALVGARWTCWALWVVAVVTLGVTVGCVYVWTRRVEQ